MQLLDVKSELGWEIQKLNQLFKGLFKDLNSERTSWVLDKSSDVLHCGDRPGNKNAASFSRHELAKAEMGRREKEFHVVQGA